MRDRPTSVSIHATTIAAKAAERDALAADVEAFLKKRGNRVQTLPGRAADTAPRPTYRQRMEQIVRSDRQRKAARRRRNAAHA